MKKKKTTYLYTIYDNRTDELLILDGTAEECAAVLCRPRNTFYRYVTRYFEDSKYIRDVGTSREKEPKYFITRTRNHGIVGDEYYGRVNKKK